MQEVSLPKQETNAQGDLGLNKHLIHMGRSQNPKCKCDVADETGLYVISLNANAQCTRPLPK